MANPLMTALMAARDKVKGGPPKVDPLENPASGDETSGTFFLAPDIFPEGPQVGDTVWVEAEVRSIGSKIALAPVSIKTDQEEEADEASGGQGENEPGEEGPQGRAKNAKERYNLG